MVNRPRRNRKSAAIRSLVRETRLTPDRLIYPLFITADESAYNPISSLPG
ncbi:MAG: porphobilinogen synthase, partial [Cryomorphaceae bacterium]